MIRLHVNVDHVATLRNQRDTAYPDPVRAARECMAAGADGITMHLREDRRHIRDHDVRSVREFLPTGLNLEMAATEEMAAIAGEVAPMAITLVPERREERTTEGGLNVTRNHALLERVVRVAARTGSRVSFFIEPNLEAVRLSRELGAVQVEFHTGHYAHVAKDARRAELRAFVEAAESAHALGLEVAAGHGLTTENVGLIAQLPHMAELNIGHAIIADAVFFGLAEAVRGFRRAIDAPGREP